jgi:hypothetical protein
MQERSIVRSIFIRDFYHRQDAKSAKKTQKPLPRKRLAVFSLNLGGLGALAFNSKFFDALALERSTQNARLRGAGGRFGEIG